jgi:hypothetical protein
MRVKASTALVLSEDEELMKAIMSVCPDIDTDFETTADNIANYEVILSETKYLKHLTDIRDKVVVLSPGAKIERYLAAGYSAFVFNRADKNELLSAFYIIGAKKASEIVEAFGLSMDFTNHVFLLLGVEVYITKSEEGYLQRRFVEKKGSTVSTDRVLLCRMRKRFGKEFLSSVVDK